VKLTPAVLDAVLAHARQAMPCECCGVLLASPTSPKTASTAITADNAAGNDPKSNYVLGHEVHLQTAKMEVAGTAHIFGYYHSHPFGRAEPSPRDTELAVEGVNYFIIGMGGGVTDWALWTFEEGKFVRAPVEIG